ncbi:unnamed protein product [Onchocerca flexuosa]|uniref:Neur_chan_LBD domain-containing protein n=1 Tax=Onchocerca flexuosa TaxID=387005 RepID=A0A183HVF3_9BILA|nr:unnamed protein product [Onchocerca flexuosa]
MHFTFVATLSPELRLRNDLMHNYNPLERPVERSDDPVVVTLGVIFQQIIDLNERQEKLEINAWLKYNWKDTKLRWDPLEYENITDLRHPAGTIWQPDILLYNRYLILLLEFQHFFIKRRLIYSHIKSHWHS